MFKVKIRLIIFIKILPNDFRCLLPNVNQETGVVDPKKEPWTTLRT
jgi:hypothetical protein